MNEKKRRCESTKNKTRILIIDDHPVVLEGLVELINREDDLVVCAKAGNSKEALEAVEKQPVDLAIIDMLLENTTGIEVTEELRSRYPNLNILILAMSDEPHYVKRSFQAGAKGYITKEDVAEGIVAAIHKVLSGEIYVSGVLARRFSSRTLERISAGEVGDSVW